MDQKVLDFWRRHSVNFVSMAFETGRRERIQHPDGYGKHSRECGDTLEIYLMSRNGRDRFGIFLHRRLHIHGRLRQCPGQHDRRQTN